MRCRCCFYLVLGLVLAFPLFSMGLPDGLFATLSTSMGDITCRLNYEDTPRTVANFVLLTEGEHTWGVDQDHGQEVSNAFYEGVTFHRVITNFMIQAGIPGNPSSAVAMYRFNDEFTSDISKRVVRSCLAMANRGQDTNATQFFIPVSRQAHLDEVHTVFGWVVEGMDVVDAISLVPTTGSVPDTPVVINSVTIIRNGTAAQNWDPSTVQPPLPEPVFIRSDIIMNTNVPVGLEVEWEYPGSMESYFYYTTNLTDLAVDVLRVTDYDGVTLGTFPDNHPNAFFWVVREGTD